MDIDPKDIELVFHRVQADIHTLLYELKTFGHTSTSVYTAAYHSLRDMIELLPEWSKY